MDIKERTQYLAELKDDLEVAKILLALEPDPVKRKKLRNTVHETRKEITIQTCVLSTLQAKQNTCEK